MKISVVLYTNDGEAKKGYPVKIIASHNGKRKRKTIGYSKLEHWNEQKELPNVHHPGYEDLFPFILNIRQQAFKVDYKSHIDIDNVMDFLLQKDEGKKVMTFYEYFDRRIEFMKAQQRFGNAKVYQETKTDLIKFWPHLKFSDINYLNLNYYKNQKKLQGLKNTSIKKNLVTVRAVFNSAIKEQLVEPVNPFLGLFDDLPIKKRRAKNYYLDAAQLKFLYHTTFKTPRMQRVSDLSLLQYFLGGSDLVDVYYLKHEDIENGRIWLKRRKLGGKSYEFDLKLVDPARQLIEKYKGSDDVWVFDWAKSHDSYKLFRDNYIRGLKVLQKAHDIKLKPRNANLTTKVFRHSFATLAKFERIEEDVIRELMGHERNDIDTIYKDKYPEEVRDKALQQMTDLIIL